MRRPPLFQRAPPKLPDDALTRLFSRARHSLLLADDFGDKLTTAAELTQEGQNLNPLGSLRIAHVISPGGIEPIRPRERTPCAQPPPRSPALDRLVGLRTACKRPEH